MIDHAIGRGWEREQALLGMARDTPESDFAAGGLAALAVPPTVRIVVLPGDPSSQTIPGEDPKTMIPSVITLPGGAQLPSHGMVRGTSSGYVAHTYSDEGQPWPSFMAVHWHGGVDVFLGPSGGHEWQPPGGPQRVVPLRQSIGWAWGAFQLQGEMVQRFGVAGPFRAIVGVARTAGATLNDLGAVSGHPMFTGVRGWPTALERHVLLLEDLPEWSDAEGVKALALRFGSRLDLAFGGTGTRHLDQTGPDQGRFVPRW